MNHMLFLDSQMEDLIEMWASVCVCQYLLRDLLFFLNSINAKDFQLFIYLFA